MAQLSHVGEDGSARMVDVSAKPVVMREATAIGRITLNPETRALVSENKIAKGNVFATARIAGIQAAKQTSQLIPLCHGLNLSHLDLDLSLGDDGVEVKCTARTAAQTGVEMEALTGVSVALLTIYDMCKAVDKEMEITGVRLLSKTKRPL
ncbi:MAG: cyclic pyranopterin monophosphate synthase MoaC [Verrucomicrobiota bacterium]|nr:cyclic pyranopterin monophosphate synthase MoaC [Verrucomicrobiota bacterium]